jgi:hypothetical protein
MSLAKNTEQILRLEKIIFVVFMVVLGSLYTLMWFHAGGFWRDEINTLNIANSSLASLWQERNFDSYPILWFLLVKLWLYVGITDSSIRFLGLLMGFMTISVIWWAARTFRLSSSLLVVFLVASIPAAIQVGTSLRAYGCGIILIIASVVIFWRMIEKPSAQRIAISMLMSVLAVQCLFQNAVLLFSLGVGALASALYIRSWQVAIAVALSGMAAGVSLLPYYDYIFSTDWVHIIRSYPDWNHMLARLTDTLGGNVQLFLWVSALILTLSSAVYVCIRRQSQHCTLIIFSGTSLITALIAYPIFLKSFGLYLQPWYFLPFLAICAILLGALIDTLIRPYVHLRIIVVALVIGAAILLAPTWVKTAQTRWTNIDLITHALNPEVDSKDFILLNSAWEGITFKRYYQGQAPWQSLPGFEGYTHLVHDWARMKQAMQEPEPLADIFAPIEETLRNGGRLWLVGNFQFLKAGESFVKLPPAPHSPYGWYLPPYERYWSQASAAFIQQNAEHVQLARAPDEAVNPYENLPVFVAWGWRESVVSE